MDILTAIQQTPGILQVKEEECPPEYGEHILLFSLCYQSGDCRVMGYLALPEKMDGALPAVLFNRGGNREFGILHPRMLCRLAQRGYVALGSQYRGNCGGTGQEEFGGADVEDVITLTDIALALPFTRHEGIYMLGHSRGGMMTYLCCARDKRIRAAAIGAGLADCFAMYRTREDSMKQVFHELVGGSPEEKPEAFQARSAVCWPEKIIPPILICQGTDDWRVVPQQAYDMDIALSRANKVHKLIVYPGADPSLKGTSYIDDVIAWFQSYPL